MKKFEIVVDGQKREAMAERMELEAGALVFYATRPDRTARE
jgi:hypothetical protein